MNYKKYIFTLVVLFSVISVGKADTTYVNVDLVPYGTFTGNIQTGGTDHSGIFISVSGTNIVGVTDASGDYTIIGVPIGVYSLIATKCGYVSEAITNQFIASAGQVNVVPSIVLTANNSTEAQLFGDAMTSYTYDDFNSAIAQLKSLLSSAPSGAYAPLARYRLGLSYANIDMLDSAIANFTLCITDFPADSIVPIAYYSRGIYKENQNDLNGALSDYQFVTANFPASTIASRAQYRIGRTYEALGNTASAITAYQLVETNYPASPDITPAIYNAGWLYYTDDNYGSAIVEFNNLLNNYAASTEAAKASYYKGMSYYNQENFAQALAEFNNSITSYPSGD
ncbi:MAG TPA: tetratricopeptide repeat protein, partial [candidate division Zixibacteria bacterium]|nr:tetratricopeptide repeat protein [candidate division Zixibacteria bacterium]